VFVRCKALQAWLEKGWITMLFYSTIFIVSLIVAVVILWFYRLSADTSKAVYTTIIPSRVDESPSDHLNDTVAHKTRTDAESPLGTKSHQTPRNLARTHRAKSIDQTPWGWPGHKRPHVRTHFASHNNLNDAPSADSASIRSQKVDWPYRDRMLVTDDKVYKATRKVPPLKKANLKTLSKPWGW
jgi:hypothetical protein